MPEILSFLLPAALLFLVAAGHLLTIFEPYYAYKRRSPELEELLEHHRQDRKLHIIAEWWAARLSGTVWYEGENPLSCLIKERILEALVRHRFLTGDDPSKLVCGKHCSGILLQALSGLSQASQLERFQEMMRIEPSTVTVREDRVIWRGLPVKYKSRFCDFYPEP